MGIPVVIYDKAKSLAPGTVAEFDALPELKIRSEKTHVPLFAPVIPLSLPAYRSNANTAFVTAWTADLDESTPAQVQACLAALAAEGLEHWAYTTHSNSEEQEKWRVFVPLATPVPGELWRRVWRVMRDRFAPSMDHRCCDASRAYYGPSATEQNKHLAVAFEVPGLPFDWSRLTLADEPQSAGVPLGPAGRRLTDDQVAEAIAHVALGFPEIGARHELALALGGALRRELVDHDQISQIVEAGFHAGGSDRPETHARTALTSATTTANGDPSYGWTTVARILGSDATSGLRDATSAMRAGINVELLRPKPEPSAAWPDAQSRVMAPLTCNSKGVPLQNGANAQRVLRGHPAWHGVLAYDLLSEAVVALKPPPSARDAYAPAGPWTDHHTTVAGYWLFDVFGLDISRAQLLDAIVATAQLERFNPVRDYLLTLKWDGEHRLDSLLPKYFACADSDYARVVGKNFMLSAVARGFEPGCQVDTMLILEGEQGTFKSSAVRALCGPEWFSCSQLDLHSKDAPQSIRGRWIYEIPELDAIKRSDMSTVKAFVTTATDHYRPSYGRFAQSFPRSCVFIGTTNEHEYLSDLDNRRFWPAHCLAKIQIEALRADRDQLWAEATERYLMGEQWHLSEEEVPLARAEQANRRVTDPWTSVISAWLEREPHEEFTLLEVFGVLQIPSERQSLGLAQRVGHVLKGLGFDTYRKRISGGSGLCSGYRKSQPKHVGKVLQLPTRGGVRQISTAPTQGVGGDAAGQGDPRDPRAVGAGQ